MKYIYLLLALILLMMCISACSKYIEKKLIFRPVLLDQDFVYEFNVPHIEFFFNSRGYKLNGVCFKTNSQLKGTIIYYHGNSKNLAHWGKNAEVFLKKGYDVYFYDYPQYGKSKGSLNEDSLYVDGLNFYDYVLDNIDYDSLHNIVLYGRSLGTTFASYTATKRSAKMLFLETPFDNMQTMFKLKAPFGLNPIRLSYKFPTDQFLPKITCPIHIIQGDEDRIVPYDSAKLLKPLLKTKDSFTFIKGGEHRNLVEFDLFHSDYLVHL